LVVEVFQATDQAPARLQRRFGSYSFLILAGHGQLIEQRHSTQSTRRKTVLFLNELIEICVQSVNHANRSERKHTDDGQPTTDYGRVTTNNGPPTTGHDKNSSKNACPHPCSSLASDTNEFDESYEDHNPLSCGRTSPGIPGGLLLRARHYQTAHKPIRESRGIREFPSHSHQHQPAAQLPIAVPRRRHFCGHYQLLSMTNVQLTNAGGYDVVVADMSGSVTSSVATLTVDPTFTKITTGSIVTDKNSYWNGSWADYDNDGYLDLFVGTWYGSKTNYLYHNNNGDAPLRV